MLFHRFEKWSEVVAQFIHAVMLTPAYRSMGYHPSVALPEGIADSEFQTGSDGSSVDPIETKTCGAPLAGRERARATARGRRRAEPRDAERRRGLAVGSMPAAPGQQGTGSPSSGGLARRTDRRRAARPAERAPRRAAGRSRSMTTGVTGIPRKTGSPDDRETTGSGPRSPHARRSARNAPTPTTLTSAMAGNVTSQPTRSATTPSATGPSALPSDDAESITPNRLPENDRSA